MLFRSLLRGRCAFHHYNLGFRFPAPSRRPWTYYGYDSPADERSSAAGTNLAVLRNQHRRALLSKSPDCGQFIHGHERWWCNNVHWHDHVDLVLSCNTLTGCPVSSSSVPDGSCWFRRVLRAGNWPGLCVPAAPDVLLIRAFRPTAMSLSCP